MTDEPPTQLIDRGELRVLVEASREDSTLAHTIRRPRAWVEPRKKMSPSALRGLIWLVAGAWLAREALHFLF